VDRHNDLEIESRWEGTIVPCVIEGEQQEFFLSGSFMSETIEIAPSPSGAVSDERARQMISTWPPSSQGTVHA